MPLSFARAGEEVTVISCSAKGEIRKRLENMGLIPGEKVTLIADRDGDIIVMVKGTRIALNRGMASTIRVG